MGVNIGTFMGVCMGVMCRSRVARHKRCVLGGP